MLFNHADPGDNARADALGGVEDVSAELNRLRDRERQFLELLGSASPDRLVHDLRNLLNEVQLLRLLAEDQA